MKIQIYDETKYRIFPKELNPQMREQLERMLTECHTIDDSYEDIYIAAGSAQPPSQPLIATDEMIIAAYKEYWVKVVRFGFENSIHEISAKIMIRDILNAALATFSESKS